VGVECLDDYFFAAAGEHALALERDDCFLAGGFVDDGHGADGLDVFLPGDDIAKEAGRCRPAIPIICRVKHDSNTTVGVQLGGLAPELLRWHR